MAARRRYRLAPATTAEWLVLLATLSGGVPLLVYFQGLERTRASTAGYFEMMQTLVAVMVTWAFFGAGLLCYQVIAAVALVAAVTLVQRAQAQTALPQRWSRSRRGPGGIAPLGGERAAGEPDAPGLGLERSGLGVADQRLDPRQVLAGVLGLDVGAEPARDQQRALAVRPLSGARPRDRVAQVLDVRPVRFGRSRGGAPAVTATAGGEAEPDKQTCDPLHAGALCTRSILASIASGLVPVVARFRHGLCRR